jgi:mono/diheme cytochrome c family protein
MKDHAISFLTGTLLVLFLLTETHAGGKEIFEKQCGSCHRSGGEAPVFAPVKFAAIQWERFFERNRHLNYKNISSLISQSDMNAVKIYLVDHAADSDMPEAIGIKVK